jgi:hypothetical protein
VKSQDYAELQVGLRCAGCGLRLTDGWEYHVLEVGLDDSKELVQKYKAIRSCGGAECPGTAELERVAVARCRVEVEWLSERKEQDEGGGQQEPTSAGSADPEGTAP